MQNGERLGSAARRMGRGRMGRGRMGRGRMGGGEGQAKWAFGHFDKQLVGTKTKRDALICEILWRFDKCD